jgi:hypothetical protein
MTQRWARTYGCAASSAQPTRAAGIPPEKKTVKKQSVKWSLFTRTTHLRFRYLGLIANAIANHKSPMQFMIDHYRLKSRNQFPISKTYRETVDSLAR